MSKRFLTSKVLEDPSLKLLTPAHRFAYLYLLILSADGKVPKDLNGASAGGMDWPEAIKALEAAGLVKSNSRTSRLVKFKQVCRLPRVSDFDATTNANISSEGVGGDRVDYEKHRIAWNRLANQYGFPQVRDLTPQRKVCLRRALKRVPDLWDLLAKEMAIFDEFVFRGRWFSMDWILREANLQKTIDGNYRKRETADPKVAEIDRIVGDLNAESIDPKDWVLPDHF